MLGAAIGDIAGSRFEFANYRKKDFVIFSRKSFFTDDTVMTLAVAKAILNCDGDFSNLSSEAVRCMQELGRPYPECGYGGRFLLWMYGNAKPYRSFGNGAAMRVSACGWAGKDLDEVKELSRKVTVVSHDHPEGIKGAEAAAVCVYMARNGASKEEIRRAVEGEYYRLDFTIDEIRPTYSFNEICQSTVPQAIEAFLEAESFEDAIRTAVSVGGDSDTIAAITGSIAEAYFGVNEDFRQKALSYLDPWMRETVSEFEKRYGK